ncbi:DUF937 domain-containing protein [Hyphomicrobium sp.]|uniref:DUF937 domain-containing protein n=1 Tax=Hyphomicrobium sp. TaxID=82 RepID=UPI002D79A1B1|nr:DUF937 domain-containing protein [Hyphomicrobium sp.]HET6389110.1 DUF937 domain-containing protein [Hyphomicrobium sp.]
MTIDAYFRSDAGQDIIAEMAAAFGIDEQSTRSAVYALSEELEVRIQRLMLSRSGVADVVSLVTTRHAPNVPPNSAALTSQDVTANGDDILNVLIGNKHVSRGIAARVASRSGLDAATVQKLLPVVATLVISELQRQAAPAIAKVAGTISGLSGAEASPLPLPGDTLPAEGERRRGPIDAGSPLPIPGDDIPGLGRRNRFPDPQSGDNPYSRLPDIIRRGGERVPGSGGDTLESVIRSILGNILGSNSGVIGTMIKLFVVRWIASLVRRVLAQATGQR